MAVDDDQTGGLTPEQNAAADADFEAAFNQARSGDTHAEGLTFENGYTTPVPGPGEAVDEAEVDPEAQAAADAAAAQAAADAEAAEAAAQAAAEANAPVAITKAELDALRAVAGQVTQLQDELKRSTDKVNGRFGSLQQTVEAIKSQAQQGIRPTKFQLKRLGTEFPDLAEMFTADLEEAFGADNATQAAPTDAPTNATDDNPASGADAPGAGPVDPLATPAVQEALRAKEMQIVDALHPDWRDLSKTAEFKEWRQQLPPAAQEILGSTWDSKTLDSAFKDFKDYREKRAAGRQVDSQRNKRLDNGIPATTGTPTGAHAVDDDAAFEQGFTQVRKGGR